MGHALSEKHDRRTDIRPCSGRVFLCAYATFFKAAPIFRPMVRKRILAVGYSQNFCETSLPDVANTGCDIRNGKAAFADTELIRENTDENAGETQRTFEQHCRRSRCGCDAFSHALNHCQTVTVQCKF